MTVHPMQNLCLAVITMMPLLSALAFGLRVWAKRRSVNGVGIDDLLIFIAVLFSFAIIYPSYRMTYMWRMGIHIWEVKWGYKEVPWDEYYVMSTIIYVISSFVLPLVKASILLVLLRVGGIIRPVRMFVYVLFAINAIGAVIPAVFYLFQCPARTGQTWTKHTFGNLRCSGRVVVGEVNIFQVSFNMFTDLLIFPIPVYLTWRLQKASMRDRLIIVCLFSVTSGATAIGAARIYLTYKEKLYQRVDVDWTWSISFCVNHLENGVAIILACVPSLRILILGWMGLQDSDEEKQGHIKEIQHKYVDSAGYSGSKGSKSNNKSIEITCLTTFDVESTTIDDNGDSIVSTTLRGDSLSSLSEPKMEERSRF